MEIIVDFIDRATKLCINTQKVSGKSLKEFLSQVQKDPELKKIAKEVEVNNINMLI